MPSFLPFLIIGAIMVVVWYVSQRNQRLHREALAAWAAGRGWRFSRQGVPSLASRFPGLKIFDRGHSRRNRNLVTGQIDGHDVTCVDYIYVTGSGKNRTTHQMGVVVLDCGFPTIPLLIRREHMFDKVGEFLGADDIDFESAEFSRKFYVKSADRKWAYDVIHNRTMEYLLQAPALNIEFGMGAIAVYSGGFNTPRAHEEALGMAKKMLELIPEYVIKQMKGEDRA